MFIKFREKKNYYCDIRNLNIEELQTIIKALHKYGAFDLEYRIKDIGEYYERNQRC